MRELRFTLYEVLGYLFPGGVSFTALVMLSWGLVWHNLRLDNLNRVSRRELVVATVFVYLLGHLTQAVANWVDRFVEGLLRSKARRVTGAIIKALKWVFLEKGIEQTTQGSLPPNVMDKVRETVLDYYGLGKVKLDDKILNVLCDAAVAVNGAPEEREIYIYREGFYRGIWLGLGSVSLATLCPLIRQWVCSDVVVTTIGHLFKPPVLAFGIVLLAASACSFLAYGRYWRFRNYRIEGSYLFFLSLAKKKAP